MRNGLGKLLPPEAVQFRIPVCPYPRIPVSPYPRIPALRSPESDRLP